MANWHPRLTPSGLSLESKDGGFIAIGQNREYGIVVVMGVILALILLLTARFWIEGMPVVLKVPFSAFVLIVLLNMAYLVSATYSIAINAKGFEFRRSFLGITWRRSLAWEKVHKLSVTRLKTLRGSDDYPDMEPRSRVIPPKIRIETPEKRWEFGGWLPDAHLLYFRDLIQYGYEAWVKAGKP